MDQLNVIVATVLKLPLSLITNETSPDCTDKWDSLAHLNLIMALEAEFQISISPEDAMEMFSVGLIRIFLEQHGVIIAKNK